MGSQDAVTDFRSVNAGLLAINAQLTMLRSTAAPLLIKRIDEQLSRKNAELQAVIEELQHTCCQLAVNLLEAHEAVLDTADRLSLALAAPSA